MQVLGPAWHGNPAVRWVWRLTLSYVRFPGKGPGLWSQTPWGMPASTAPREAEERRSSASGKPKQARRAAGCQEVGRPDRQIDPRRGRRRARPDRRLGMDEEPPGSGMEPGGLPTYRAGRRRDRMKPWYPRTGRGSLNVGEPAKRAGPEGSGSCRPGKRAKHPERLPSLLMVALAVPRAGRPGREPPGSRQKRLTVAGPDCVPTTGPGFRAQWRTSRATALGCFWVCRVGDEKGAWAPPKQDNGAGRRVGINMRGLRGGMV